MTWLKKKSPLIDPIMDNRHAVEIIAHKDASKEVVQQARVANQQLKRLFAENGFTVKIVLAMGAKQIRGGHKT